MIGRNHRAADPPRLEGEFKRGWRVLLGSAFGMGLGISGLLTYNSGLFVSGLGKELGLSRTAYGAAFFASTVAIALAMPWVGRAVDRFGPRTCASVGAIALSGGFLALSQVRSVWAYVFVMAAIGLVAAASTPVPFMRAVADSFRRSCGLALGLTQAGIGIAAALIPPAISAVIAQNGWRSGFLALAGLAALGLLAALLALPSKVAGSDEGAGAPDAFNAVRRSRVYKIQISAFAAMALAFAGLLSHFVPLLRDAGLSIERAGALAGLIGLSVIVTRLIVGWLSDRVEPAWLGAASCAICGLGCVFLAIGGPSVAPAAAIALGAAMGAEADLVGILTARNFPLLSFSRAYSRQYSAFILAAGVSPLWIGYLADSTGNYELALYLSAAGLLVPITLFAALARLTVP